MNCPVCSTPMAEKDFGGAHVDVCEDGCKGIWFDWLELRKLDESNEGCGNALEEALNHPRSNDEGRPRLNCPKCSIPMHTHAYKSSKETNVDECYGCAGFFLDSGELKLIRDTYMTDEEREQYTQNLLADIPEYVEQKENLEKKKLRMEAIKKFSIFLMFKPRKGSF